MIQIKGKITEITKGVDAHSLTIQDGKAKSKVKFNPSEIDIDEFEIGQSPTIVIEKDATLFDHGDHPGASGTNPSKGS